MLKIKSYFHLAVRVNDQVVLLQKLKGWPAASYTEEKCIGAAIGS